MMRRRFLPFAAALAVLLAALLAEPPLPAIAVGAGGDVRTHRPQEPALPLPYTAREVSFHAAGDVRLAGTLSMPDGTGQFPAVVLVAGTGPQDRDAAVAGHRPFLVLADYLVRNGVAVLRYDERGVGASTGTHHTATTADFAGDAAAAHAWLAAQPAIDSRRVGILGHSEGGMVAPLVAASRDDVAFLVLLAAPGVPLRQLGVRQAGSMALAEGAPARDVARNVRMASGIMALFGHDLDAPTLQQRARPILEEGFAGMPPWVREREVERALSYYTSPWAQWAMRYDPAATLRSVRAPVLAMTGARDRQVHAGDNLAAISRALRDGGNRRVTVRELPRLNHYFQTARTGALSEVGRIDETFSPAALHLIGEWVLQQRPR